MKNSNDIIENRTGDLPACSAVPQPTAPPRTQHVDIGPIINLFHAYECKPPITETTRHEAYCSNVCYYVKCIVDTLFCTSDRVIKIQTYLQNKDVT